MRERKWAKLCIEDPDGRYYKEDIFVNETSVDLLLTTEKQRTKFYVSVSVGGNYNNIKTRDNSVLVQKLVLPEMFSVGNSDGATIPDEYSTEQLSYSTFSFAKIAYNDLFFIDLTARNDWSSTLPKGNRSFFYPSVSTSLILSELPIFKNKYIDFAKIRAGWAVVGNSAGPYQLNSTLGSATSFNNNLIFL